jgi:hypothetical protein
MKLLLTLLIFLLSCTLLSAQVTLTIRINSGSSGTSCTDGFLGGGPELNWRVNTENQGWLTYPATGVCYNNTPNTQYSEVFNCSSNYPVELQVCFRAFEDDGAVCVPSQSCMEEACLNFPTPAPGGTITQNINIPNNGTNASWGNVNFTISATGSFASNGNDLICNAINLGTLTSGGSLGNSALSNYNNFCATNAGDPTPGTWSNEQGVWFQFTTGATPSATISFDLNNDPQSFGDPIDLQVALYESSNNACTGALTLIQADYDGVGVVLDEEMDVNCLNPNTTYFILVDGQSTFPFLMGGGEGYFGIQISDDGIVQAGDEICDAEDLGLVPNGGSVSTTLLSQSNICATNTNDPTPAAWAADKTVWFEFQAPATGSVIINANSDLPFPIGTNGIDIQLALYETNTGFCSGTVNYLGGNYTPGFFDEDLTIRCLTPGQSYWVLVDGSATDTDGIFDITITDEGNVPAPNDLICNAISLGEPAPNGTVGLNSQHNYCANNLFEPIPNNWGNNQGVWYTFIAPPSGKVEVRLNDYGPLGPDGIDLQVAVYELSGNVCTGAPAELVSGYEGNGLVWDEDIWVECLIPGQEYWILVDGQGSITDPDLEEGIFDIEVFADPQDPPALNNAPCDAIALGNPTGSSVSTTPAATHGSQNNFCADATGEPQPNNFVADQTVWYTFVAPSTGAVNIAVNSDDIIFGVDAINLEMAVYSSPGCSGPWVEKMSGSGVNNDVNTDLWCLIPGDTYYIQIDGASPILFGGHEGYFDLTITEIPPIPVAPNDLICGAIALGNPWTAPITISGQHNLCGDNVGDPVPNAFTSEQSVWYTFNTPLTGGPFTLDIQGTSDLPWPFGVDDIDLQLAVFSSSDELCTGSLTEITSGYSLLNQNNEFLNVPCLEENRTYYLMVDGSNANVEGYFDLNLSAATAVPIPSNNDICNFENLGAVPIGGSINDGVDYFNFCSDIETGEPSVYTDGIQQTVWFSFVAPNHVGPNATSNVTVSVNSDPNNVGNTIDLQLAVFESSDGICSGTMTLVNDGSSDPIFSFDATTSITCLAPGQTYFVQVDGSISNPEGYFTVDIVDDGQGVSPPYNTLCLAENLGVVPNGGSINNGTDYTNLCMDTENGEAVASAFSIENTAWFTFVAPASGNVTINALNDPNNTGDEVDLQLALYYSSNNLCSGSMLEVSSSYSFLNKDESLTVDCLESGKIYFLQVDGAGGLLGDVDGWFTLNITDDGGVSNAPYNNNICNAYDFGIPNTIQTLLAETNSCANIESGEPGVGTYATHTVWYEFTAPTSGQVDVSVTSTDVLFGMDPEVYIYSSSDNTCSGMLTEAGSSLLPTALVTETIEAKCLIPGNVYFIQVDGQLSTIEGTFNISIEDMLPDYGTGLVGDVEPSNNDCANSISLTVQSESCISGSGVFDQNNYGVSTPSNASAMGCGMNCGDTWYSFTMPANGNALIEGNDDGVLGDFSQLNVIAYSGSCANLNMLDCDLGGLTNDISMDVTAAAGSTVYLQISNEGANDDGEAFELCVSEACGFDDCLDALTSTMDPGVPYCFNTIPATGENVAGGDPGYDECGEGDNPENSLYYSFITDATGGDVTVSVINAGVNGNCILGITPTDGFNISLFQDNTPCDNVADALIDCENFTACDVQPINWSQTYSGLPPNTTFIIQIDGGFGTLGGNNSGQIQVDGDILLGVDLVHFYGNKNGRNSDLFWSTINETQNDYFTLERAIPDNEFETIATVNGDGNSTEQTNYSYIDYNPFIGMNYYKLSQTDLNGVRTELGIIAIDHSTTSESLIIIPNPVNDNPTLVFNSESNETVNFQVFSSSGQLIESRSEEAFNGSNSFTLDTRKLLPGMYYVRLFKGSDVHIVKFVK